MGILKAKAVFLALVVTTAAGSAVGYVGLSAAPVAPPPAPAGPTLDDLKAENERLRREVADLRGKLAAAEARLPGGEAPTDQEVLRAMPRVPRGIPYAYETFRDDIVIVKQKVLDRLDPPKSFPNVGLARLRVQCWECSVYFTETVEAVWPFPARVTTSRVQVVYIDKDALELVKGGAK